MTVTALRSTAAISVKIGSRPSIALGPCQTSEWLARSCIFAIIPNDFNRAECS